MITESSIVTPKFIELQPDWSRPVSVAMDFSTSIAESQSESRQRARWRKQPRYSLSYSLSVLTTTEFSARRSAIIGELQSPVVVPIWTDAFELESMTSTHVANLGESLAKKKFKVGSYAYFVQTGIVSTFRKITAISGTSLTFESATVPVFTSGATIYPCIFGQRPKDGAAFTANLIDQTDEQISIEEL